MDTDDKGYLYLATYYYGWGILKDDMLTDGSVLTSVYQYSTKMQIQDDISPAVIMVLKSANNPSTYYALVSDTASVTNVFDVSNPSSPVRYSSVRRPFLTKFAKTADLTRYGAVMTDGK